MTKRVQSSLKIMPEAIEERVDALPSEDNGNVAMDDIKPEPSPEPKPDVPNEKKEPELAPTEPKVEKYKLPDGREVTADELYKEHTENLLPEFTRRSQELARLKNGDSKELPNNGPTPKAYENPEWAPKSYAELIEIAKAEVRGDLEAEERTRVETEKAIETEVLTQLGEIKKIDPNLNENDLFVHANKYHFTDLRLAYENKKEMSEAVKKVQKTTTDNITKRSDPVSMKPGAGGGAGVGPSSFGNAVEYLRSLKK